MDRSDERDQRLRGMEDRLARLSAASLRINESLDFDTVLQEVVDSARELTASRYGAITIPGEVFRRPTFITSGLTREELQGFWDMPEGLGFFEYLSGLEEPLRVSDIDSHLKALNMPDFMPSVSVSSVLVAPIRHLGVGIGTIYLAHERGGGEFTREDEETLLMFASQAALVIANARRHWEERRARADLETLIDTSPVGVVVFDAATGEPRSLNREARRIVDGLRDPSQPPEDLLNLLIFRRGDGRVISLRDFPMSELLGIGETLRSEQIVLGVPDGRSVTVLLNATPILSDEGAVESMIVTLQDMSAIEELERMRADFLAMVSHELRAPLATIKGSSSTVLDSSTDMDPAVMRQFFRIIAEQADNMNTIVGDLLDVARIETGTLSISPEPAEAAVLVDRARNAFKSAGGRNNLAIDVDPDLPLVMADRRRIVQVLNNLLTNAARHSLESSDIKVAAFLDNVHVVISVTDEGRGIPAEGLPRLFRKFSRVRSDEKEGNTGLGLAICKGIVEAHGGRIWAESDRPGLGARFSFTLPTVETAGGGSTSGAPLVFNKSRRRDERRNSEERVRVLVVDDDPDDLRYVRDTLVQSGYDPVVTGDPEEALRITTEERPGLALLDLMLPGTDGIELAREILEVASVPVIILSAYGREEVIVRAFEIGAVDYVVKPFSPTELLARIRSALRRRVAVEPLQTYVLGELTIEYSKRRVTLAGRRVPLTPTEYAMLAELSVHAGEALTHEHLLERVWGETTSSDIRPMRTIVSKLRRKLGETAGNPTYIFTETRVGFLMPKGENPDGEKSATT